MALPEKQLEELTEVYGEVLVATDGGIDFVLINTLSLPPGCSPSTTRALLCPTPRDGYNSRLFFPEKIQESLSRNWNAQNIRILDSNWFAISWKTDPGLSLLQMVRCHLDGLKQ